MNPEPSDFEPIDFEPIDFKTALVDLIDDSWPTGAHPPPEEVAQLRRGELTEERAEPLREHLLSCRECLELWRTPASTHSTAAAGGEVVDFERAAFWRLLRPRLGDHSKAHRAPSAPSSPASLAGARRLVPWLAAASLLLVSGLSGWIAVQQNRLSTPRANAPIYDLDATFEPRDGSLSEALVVPAGVGFTLLITPDAWIGAARCELDILDDAGHTVHTVRGLTRHPNDGTLSLWLPADALTVGTYHLELREEAGADRNLLETYTLRVTPPP